jgi:hypothetical protein
MTLTTPTISSVRDSVLGGDWAGVASVADHSLVNVLRGLGTRHRIAWNTADARYDVYSEDGITVAYHIVPTTDAGALPIIGVTPA